MSEVTIRIKGDDDSDSAFRKARNNEERLTAAAKAAGIELVVMGQKGEQAGKISADGADRARAGVTRLNAGIDELNKGVKVLQEEFERTGDVDFLRQSKRLTTARKELEGFKKELVALGEDGGTESGKGFVGRFLDEVSGGFKGDLGKKLQALPSQLKGAMIAGLAGVAVAAAPALGAAVSLAVLGGVGVGGIIGGVALAAKDPAVAATAEQVGQHIGDSLTGMASASFKQPAVESLRILEDEYNQLEPRIGRIFDKLAPHVTNLAHGVADGVDRLGVSIEHTVDRAGPVIDEIAADIPILVGGIGDFMDEVSQGGPGAVQFMHDFATGTRNTLEGIGFLIKELSQLYDFIRNNPLSTFVVGMGNVFMDLTNGSGHAKKALYDLKVEQAGAAAAAETHEAALDHLHLGADLATADFTKLSGAISATAQTTDVLAGAMTDKIINTSMNLDQAVLGVAESETRLSAAIQDNGRALDIHTEKGQANREAVLSVVSANLRQYDSLISAGVSAQDAAAAYDANTAALEKQMRQAGFTKQQVDDLIGKYRAVPDKVNTNIAMQGLTAAISGLDETIRLINHLPAYKRISVDVVYSQVGSLGAAAGGRIIRANAHGGVVGAASGGARNGLTMVGEHGIELLDLPPGTTVHSNPDSQRMLANAAAGAGGGGFSGRSVLEVRPAPGFDSEIMRGFLGMITMSLRNDAAFIGAVQAAVQGAA